MTTGADPWARAKELGRGLEPALVGLAGHQLEDPSSRSKPAAGASQPQNPTAPPWLAVNPDGWVEHDGRRLLVVVKNVPWCRASETPWPPPWLYAVVQHELAATGAQGAVVGALFAGAAFKVGQMGADSSYQAALLRDEAAFMARLEAGNPPPAEGHSADLAAVRELYPEDDGSTAVALGTRAAAAWARCKALRAKARAYRRAAEAEEARLRAAIGQHAGARLPGGGRLLLRRVGQGRRLVEVR